MRRPDKRGLRGHETAGQTGGSGMQPKGKWTRVDRAGVTDYMHLYSWAIGILLYNM